MTESTDPKSAAGTVLDSVALSGWAAGSAGLHFSTAAESWNVCGGDGAIRTAAGDGDYLFLDDTASGRAALNAGRFLDDDGVADIEGLRHAARLMTIALDITIAVVTHPTPRMAQRVWAYRPVSISITGIAALLTGSGIAYDSVAGRNTAAALCALVTGTAYAASAEMAQELGAFPQWETNRDRMTRVIDNHAGALAGTTEGYDRGGWPPMPLDDAACAVPGLADAARTVWSEVAGAASGYRNAQVTAIFPAAAETRMLDAETRGTAPGTAIVDCERLESGGFRRTVGRRVLRGLRALGYDDGARDAILRRALGHASIEHAPGVNHETLRRRGFTEKALARLETALADVTDIRQAFHAGVLGETFCRRMLGFAADVLEDPRFDMLAALGFSEAAIEAANNYCCGADTLDGAPRLSADHRAVFDCALRTGERSNRFVSSEAVVRMLAAVQPFVSGGVGHHVVLPRTAPVRSFRSLLMLGWGLGLRTLTLMRDRPVISAPAAADIPATDRSIHLVASGGEGEAVGPLPAGRRDGSAWATLPVPADRHGAMSQALALAHTASGLSADQAMKKSIDARPERDAADASPSRRESPDSPRSATSVSSSADVVVEQRQV